MSNWIGKQALHYLYRPTKTYSRLAGNAIAVAMPTGLRNHGLSTPVQMQIFSRVLHTSPKCREPAKKPTCEVCRLNATNIVTSARAPKLQTGVPGKIATLYCHQYHEAYFSEKREQIRSGGRDSPRNTKRQTRCLENVEVDPRKRVPLSHAVALLVGSMNENGENWFMKPDKSQ